MAQVSVQIADDVAGVLRRATTDGNAVRLSDEQLDRKLYQATDKVLQALGGKWNTKARAHVFANDPAEKLAAALGDGRAIDELMTRKKTLQFFETPAELAARLVAKLGDISEDVCLEPSAGRGRIVAALSAAGAMAITAVEIDRDNAEAVLAQHIAIPVICGDFLTQELLATAVAMNPPFTRNQDIQHVRHAYSCLASNGRLVANRRRAWLHWPGTRGGRVASMAGIGRRGNRDHPRRRLQGEWHVNSNAHDLHQKGVLGMTSYKDSLAYQRSTRLRPDGRPQWPVTSEDYPSLPAAHERVAQRNQARDLERRVRAAGGVG